MVKGEKSNGVINSLEPQDATFGIPKGQSWESKPGMFSVVQQCHEIESGV